MKLINADLLKEKAKDMRFRSAEDICRIIDDIPDESENLATNLQPDCNVAMDMISRQSAIDAVTPYCLLHDLRDLLAELETLPSVQPERRNEVEMKSLNLNDRIKVKLTPLGVTIFYHQYDDLLKDHPQIKSIKPTMPRIDKDGYTSFQLWCFIELYGEFIGMGQEQVIEDNRIYFEIEKEE